MKYYRYLIWSIVNCIITKRIITFDKIINNQHDTLIFLVILMLCFWFIFFNMYKFIRIRFNLSFREVIKWSFTNEQWKIYVINETKERLKCLGSGLRSFFIIYLFYCIASLNSDRSIIINIVVIGLVTPMLIVLYNFVQTMFFYFININSNGEIIMTKKLILINGEFNDVNYFIKSDSKTIKKEIQYSIYYDCSKQFNILEIKCGEIDTICHKNNKLKVRKTIRIPIKTKDYDIISSIKDILKVRIKRKEFKK